MTMCMEQVQASLRRALSEAKFDTGRSLTVRPSLRSTSYASGSNEILRPERLREIHKQAKWDDEELRRARDASVLMPESLREELTESLCNALTDYYDADSDSIGHVIPMAGSHERYIKALKNGLYVSGYSSSMRGFGAGLVKGAAILGVDRMMDLLVSWTQGKPLTHRTCTVVSLVLDRPLAPTSSIYLDPLPLSTDKLPTALPSGSNIQGSDYLGHTIVSAETVVTPSLFHPGSQNALDAKLTLGVPLETIWEVLSLECNAYVKTGLRWNDYGDLSALATKDGRTWGSSSQLSHPPEAILSIEMTSLGVATLDLHSVARQTLSENKIKYLFKAFERADSRVRVAVERWRKSRVPNASLTDQFIDLRIALEALFLDQAQDQQMKFRLAVFGAWLVGENAESRRSTWDVLRRAYDTSSRAIHRGKVSPNKENSTLLSEAQSVCREGIYHVLKNGRVTDWQGLILGCNAAS